MCYIIMNDIKLWVDEQMITNPIPIPYINLPITITGKLGAKAVSRAPIRYKRAPMINSLLLP